MRRTAVALSVGEGHGILRPGANPHFSPWPRPALRPSVRSARSGPKSVAVPTVEARIARPRALTRDAAGGRLGATRWAPHSPRVSPEETISTRSGLGAYPVERAPNLDNRHTPVLRSGPAERSCGSVDTPAWHESRFRRSQEMSCWASKPADECLSGRAAGSLARRPMRSGGEQQGDE